MPRYSKYKKNYRKKRISKKKNGVLQVRNTYDMGLFTGSVKQSLPLGKTVRVQLKYAETFELMTTTSGGLPAYKFYRLNSLYDPNLTGIGRKARGFDELMVFYNSYVVIGCRMTAIRRAQTPDTLSNSHPGIFGIMVNSSKDTSTLTKANDFLEQGYCRYQPIKPNEPTQVRIDINPNKFLAIKNPLDDDGVHGDKTSTSNINPTEQVWGMVFADLGNNTISTSVRFDVILEYTAILFDPAQNVPTSS